jgi:putative ABC transport system permease protein
MLQNYFKVALRNLWRNKLYTAINTLGLAIGISSCLAIYLICSYEFSFDTFRTDYDKIYRIYSTFSGIFDADNPGTPTGMALLVAEEETLLESHTSFFTTSGKIKVAENKVFKDQERIAIADANFFEVFKDFEWLAGSPLTSLSEPNQVVLTEKRAKQYFDTEQVTHVIGENIYYNDSLLLTVSGILANTNQRTDIDFEVFISYSTINNSWLNQLFALNNWTNTNSNHQVFVKLASGIDKEQAASIIGQKAKEQYDIHLDGKFDINASFLFQAFSNLHFNTDLNIFSNSRAPAHLPTLYALLGIAALLLFLAIINFVNLETAQSLRRMKEVGVRKVVGSSRWQLIKQFLTETLVLTTIAVGIAIPLTQLALVYFKDYIPEGVVLDLGYLPNIIFLGSITLGVTLLAGCYPALILSGFKPAMAFKPQARLATKGLGQVNFRKALIVFQFIIAQALIFGNIAIGKQLHYMLNKDLGFSKDAVVYLYFPWQSDFEKREILANEVKQYPEVKALSLHQQTPSSFNTSTSVIGYQPDNGEKIKYSAHRKFGDTSYIHVYDIDLVAGRNLRAVDSLEEVLINEQYVEYLGFEQPQDAIGEVLTYGDTRLPIVGVVKNFHLASLHSKIKPAIIGSDPVDYNMLSIKLQTAQQSAADFDQTIAKLENDWNEIFPDIAFEYHFMDEAVAKFYDNERRASVLSNFAMTIAILISCLGLLGLISYTATQRTKEIGIRKVLGASIGQLVSLLTKDFILLALIASFIALPLGWYLSKQWLQDFAYQIGIEWWMFAVVVLGTVLIALITVSFKAINVALANPANSLKHE